jgi:Class II Aldolase and Adducin N-terminal domain
VSLCGLSDMAVAPRLVQASNGNTSIKLDGILWIKASGKWLAHAMKEEMFVPLELAKVRVSIQNDTEIASPYTPNHELSPSIETAMHALLRHRVVLHVHENEATSGDDWVHLWEVGTSIGDAPRRKLRNFTQGDLPANFTGIEVIRGQSSPGRRNHRAATVCDADSFLIEEGTKISSRLTPQ